MPATPDSNERIVTGLKFLAKADVAAVKAAVLLEVLEGNPHPPGVADLIHRYPFLVDGINYTGRMTLPQFEYLSGQTGTLETFAAAVSQLIINSNMSFLDVLGDLNRSLGVPPAHPTKLAPKPLNGDPIVINPPPVGCCTFDDGEKEPNITEAFCIGGLQGTSWVQGSDCTGVPPVAKKKPAKSPRAK